jgi:hypothetical protein
MVAAVCADIGRSARWSRLDGLLAGPLSDLAPRLASLVAAGTPTASQEPIWVDLDQHCWGHAGTAEALFPLVVARMPALCDTPVFMRSEEPLLSALARAAATGEGLRVDTAQATELDALVQEGAPVWVRRIAADQFEACLTLAARVEQAGSVVGAASNAPFSLGVAQLARRSAVVASTAAVAGSFWRAADGSLSAAAYLDVAPSTRWPEESAIGIPDAPSLRELVAARRSGSSSADAADEALRRLADHTLYGFWLQVLLLEALDRELGEPSLFLAHDPTSEPAAPRVYYRPRLAARGAVLAPMLLLGSVDAVLPRLASALHIHAVGLIGEGHGPWSRALELLAQVGLVLPTGDRWTITPDVLDRLHGGGLMTAVLRRGRDLREHLHAVLDGLWATTGGAR